MKHPLLPLLVLAAVLLASCAKTEPVTTTAPVPETVVQTAPPETEALPETAAPETTVPEETEPETEPFEPAFTFTTVDFEGNEVTEQIFAGHKFTILNFWEPWCGPCVAEMPSLASRYNMHKAEGVQIVGVFATEGMDGDVAQVLADCKVSYPIIRYAPEFDQFQTGYVPTTVILDGQGNVLRAPFVGAMDAPDWEALVQELLAEVG